MPTAVYAGSFDPPTNGHVWMIRKGAALFDKLIVAVGVNPDKHATFTLDQRMIWLHEITADLDNIAIDHFGPLYLANFAKGAGAPYILRGIRNESDYAYEHTMRNVNEDLVPTLTSVFLMPPRQLVELSSSFVKGMVGPAGWESIVRGYVPECVFDGLVRWHEEQVG
jgi:pantetheine-phosphate adenylyltransferase